MLKSPYNLQKLSHEIEYEEIDANIIFSIYDIRSGKIITENSRTNIAFKNLIKHTTN